jgi:tetratricopeptide (TPR) repeat protein
LAQIGYGGDTDVGHSCAANAVGILVKRGDFSAAGELLHYVNDPEAYEDMLIQKRYAPLWQQLEELVGPHLEKVRASSLRSMKTEYLDAPDDHEKLQRYVNALRHSGRLGEAIGLRSKLPETEAEMASADQPMGWAVNNVALALHEAGRADDADRLFAMLNDAPMPKENWRISMKINRLELLVGDGKFDKALPLIEPTAKTEGSDYADQLVRRLRYCTLSSLGRKDEAAKYLPDMLKHMEDAPGPTVDGLVCAHEFDKAEQVVLEELKNADGSKRLEFEADFVRHLQKQPLTSDDPSIWQGLWQQLRARPAIQQAFDRLGRDMPSQFLPPNGATASAN